MAELFDLIVKGGTVVNHDGEAVRDIGIVGGRIAAIGDISATRAAEVIDAKGLHVLPGVIDSQVHFREPGLEHKEDLATGSRAAVMRRRHGRVRDAEHQAADHRPRRRSPTRSRGARTGCTAISPSTSAGRAENIDDIPHLERLEASAGIKVFMGASTGDLLVEDEASLEKIIAAISRRAAFHAEDEARLRERAKLRVPGDPSSHPVWRDEVAAMIATERLVRLRREAPPARACAARLDRRRDGVPARSQGVGERRGDAASPDLDGARLLRAARHLCPDEPAGARCRAIARRSGRASPTAPSTCSAPTMPRTPREEKDHPYPESHSGMTGVQTLVPVMLDHVNAGRLSLAAVRRPDKPRSRSGCSGSAARVGLPSATMPT